MANDVAGMSAQAWVNAMMYGSGAHSGQYGSGYGQSGLGALFGGLSMAGPAMFGGGGTSQGMAGSIMLPALIANMFAAPSTPIVGGATANLMGRSMMGLAAAGAFGNVQGGGGTLPGGFGLGQQATAGITSTMEGMTGTGPRDLGMGDVSRITQMAGQGGFFQSTTQVRQVRERLKEMVNTVKSLSQELTMTIDEVSSGMNAMRGMGYNTAGSAGTALRQVMRSAAASGMAPSEMMAYTAQQGELLRQAGHVPLALGAAAARNTLGFVGAGARAGLVSEEALQNAYGASGAEGAMAMSNRVQELGLRMMNRAPMQFSLAAMMDPNTGKLSQERMNQMLSGQMSAGDIQRQASQYVQSLGPGGYAKWLGQMPEMRGQFMAAGGAMAPIALAGTLMGQHGYEMDPNDPRSRAAFGRVMSRMSGTQVDPMEARAMMEMYSNMGNISEQQQLSASRQQRQEQRAESIASRYAARDPSYQLAEMQRTRLAGTTSFIERQATTVAARLERLTSSATGMGFDVMVSSELYSGGQGVRGLLSGGAQRATGEQMGFFRESGTDVEGRAGVEAIRGAIGEATSFSERRAGRRRLRAAEGMVRATEAEQGFYTREFMGNDRGHFSMSSERLRDHLRSQGRGLNALGVSELQRTGGAREALLMAYRGSTDAQKEELQKLYGSSLSGSMTDTQFMEQLAGGSAEQAAGAARVLSGGEDTEARRRGWKDLGAAWQESSKVAVTARKRTGLGYGELEYAADTVIGKRYQREGLVGLQAAARASAEKAFGATGATAGIGFIEGNVELAGQLRAALDKGITGSTIGELMKSGGISTAGVGADITSMKVADVAALKETLRLEGGVLNAAQAEEMRQVGALSDTRMTRTREILQGGGKLGKGARTYGQDMLAAGEMLRSGDAQGALTKEAGALVNLARGGGMDEAIRTGIVSETLASEAQDFRRHLKSGGGISLEEFRAKFGQDLSNKAIAEMSGGRVSEAVLTKADPKKAVEGLEMIWARAAVAPGQGTPSTAAQGGSADLATQFGNILGAYGQGGALRVVVTNPTGGTGGDVAEPPTPGGSMSGGSAYFPGH